VIGGLYGNRPALDVIDALVAAEPGPVTLCFNGDFNWFNVDHGGFTEINRRVLAHDAICGNVEAELGVSADDAGCGCAYPDTVAAAVVERSNRIHARLKATAARHPELVSRLAALPMLARYRIGDARIGIVHGDADALAGWGFDVSALDAADRRPWIDRVFEQAKVEVFASTHTCLPALRVFDSPAGQPRVIINNGAAGMPNFAGERAGLLTRISLTPSPHAPMYGVKHGDVHVDALAIRYDAARWENEFLANWPAGSDAWQSYFQRIRNGPNFQAGQAAPRQTPQLAKKFAAMPLISHQAAERERRSVARAQAITSGAGASNYPVLSHPTASFNLPPLRITYKAVMPMRAASMNFNIYLDDETGQQLNQVAKKVGESRNALVRQAVSEWLKRQGQAQWPAELLAFTGISDMPTFEAGRDRLKPPTEDPLA